VLAEGKYPFVSVLWPAGVAGGGARKREAGLWSDILVHAMRNKGTGERTAEAKTKGNCTKGKWEEGAKKLGAARAEDARRRRQGWWELHTSTVMVRLRHGPV
jgi:hypothetical protein